MKSSRSSVSARGKLPPTVRLGRSGVHGYGLFARDFIPQGEPVIEYVGERVTKAEVERRELQRLARRAAGGDGCVYVFDLNKRYDIDGNVPWNLARRINHSCGPNCEPRGIRGRIWIVALRDIAPDEELTYDYGFDYDGWRDHPCRCGAPGCVGFIINLGQRWRVRRILAAERVGQGRGRMTAGGARPSDGLSGGSGKPGFSSPPLPSRSTA